MRVVVVEDSALIAMELREVLLEEGHEVIGVATTVGEADALAQGAEIAVLDILLPDGATYDLARRLSAQGAGIVFASAVRSSDIPRDLAHWPFLAKPYGIGALCRAVASLKRARKRGRAITTPGAARVRRR